MGKKRALIHDTDLTIRVSEDLKRRAMETAHRQGMSLSEAIRQFLRKLAKQID